VASLKSNPSTDKIGLSPPPCLRRVKRLRALGIITHDVSIIDPFKVGHRLVVFVNITLEKQREDLLANFERKMLEHAEVLQCYFVSGDTDYFLIMHVSDMLISQCFFGIKPVT